MTEPVRRGGREQERMAKVEADQRAAQERERLEWLSDLRLVLARPEGRRVIGAIVARSKCFVVPAGLPHDVVREHLGAAVQGMQLWNDIVAADPNAAVALLDLPKPKEPHV